LPGRPNVWWLYGTQAGAILVLMLKKHQKHFKRVLHAGLVLAGVFFVVSGMHGAGAQDVTQGYLAEGTLQNGLIVRLQANDKGKVEPLTQEQENDMFGVVVSSSEAPVSLSDPSQVQVFVANFGQYEVLVSTQNGPVRAGDGLVISSVKGVAMKADDLHRVVVGKALENFADNADAESKVKLASGRTVAVGRIKVDINVARNPTYSGDRIAGVPHFLSRAAHAVTDKPVTALRIYAGLAIIFVCLAVAGGILYAGIRSGMTAIGRNPLAKKSIVRNLITIILMALTVVSVGLIAVYLLLRI
jgi:hypothetical protein